MLRCFTLVHAWKCPFLAVVDVIAEGQQLLVASHHVSDFARIQIDMKRVVFIAGCCTLFLATALFLARDNNAEKPMGMWDKIRSVFGKTSDPTLPADEQEDMVPVFDKYGRELLVPKEEWRKNVLPGQLNDATDDPGALYQAIVMALNDEFGNEVLNASDRLLQIDPDKERSHVVRAIVLLKTGDLDGSERVLSDYVTGFGATGTVLTNLAKVHAERGDEERAAKTLWDGLKIDPNQENGLMWWASIHQERDGKAGFHKSMKKAASIPGSWRPQLWLARSCLEQNDLGKAKEYYVEILQVAADQGDVLMQISGDLGNNGYIDEILAMLLPVYDAEKHGVLPGFNLLEAYLQKKEYVEGEQFLQRLYALNRPDIRERLHHYATEFEKLQDTAEPLTERPSEPVGFDAIRIEKPIWAYGLNDPQWLFESVKGRIGTVMLVSLANTTPTTATKPFQQKEDEVGRLSRSIPLYLGEAVYFWTNIRPIVVIPVAKNRGPVVYGAPWPLEQIEQLADGVADTVIYGSLEQRDELLTVSLNIWEQGSTTTRQLVLETARRDQIGQTVLDFEQKVLSRVASPSAVLTAPTESFYVRPGPKLVDPYLICLGQSLMMTLVQNGYVREDQLWGERNMLDYSLQLAVDSNEWQVAKLVFLSSLAKSSAYESSVLNEYKDKALALLEDETDMDSPFYRLSPLLFHTFDMEGNFLRRVESLRHKSDQPYSDWLEALQRD